MDRPYDQDNEEFLDSTEFIIQREGIFTWMWSVIRCKDGEITCSFGTSPSLYLARRQVSLNWE